VNVTRPNRIDSKETTMQGVYLKFYVQEKRHHHGILAYEWLLEAARKLGIHGGSAFRAIAGFGRHGKLHEEHFFELAGDVSVEVGFALTEEEAQKLLAHLSNEKLRMFYIKVPLEMGVVGEEP
jgi:PII-like signaling protein